MQIIFENTFYFFLFGIDFSPIESIQLEKGINHQKKQIQMATVELMVCILGNVEINNPIHFLVLLQQKVSKRKILSRCLTNNKYALITERVIECLGYIVISHPNPS